MMNRQESVWDAIERTPALAENMKIRSALMSALEEHIRGEGLTQKQAAKKFGVTQPRISDLTRGRIDLFSIDTLVNMLATNGARIELQIGRGRLAFGFEVDRIFGFFRHLRLDFVHLRRCITKTSHGVKSLEGATLHFLHCRKAVQSTFHPLTTASQTCPV